MCTSKFNILFVSYHEFLELIIVFLRFWLECWKVVGHPSLFYAVFFTHNLKEKHLPLCVLKVFSTNIYLTAFFKKNKNFYFSPLPAKYLVGKISQESLSGRTWDCSEKETRGLLVSQYRPLVHFHTATLLDLLPSANVQPQPSVRTHSIRRDCGCLIRVT